MKKQIILASASPRRKQLLGEIVEEFLVLPCEAEEEHPNLLPRAFVKYLARFKAKNVFEALPDKKDKIVIGSDTIVVKNGKIIGKPKDKNDAESILQGLSGKTHYVYTGVSIITQKKEKVFYVKSRVKFFKLSKKQIDEYIKTGSAFDKAGAYGVQDSGFVKKIRGSYSCVVGLPVERLKKEIAPFLNNTND